MIERCPDFLEPGSLIGRFGWVQACRDFEARMWAPSSGVNAPCRPPRAFRHRFAADHPPGESSDDTRCRFAGRSA